MKKIVFLSGTRADFGKLKSLINIAEKSKDFEVYLFITGIHMNSRYGRTVDEIEKQGYKNIFCFYNHYDSDGMDTILAKTIEGFSHYIHDINPDLIIIHGDRVEALAGAIVGSLNNILTAHIEGGEVSGTIDESIRHSVSKISHLHFVSNDEARKRLLQMGEDDSSIFTIGSPDIDLMLSKNLPSIDEAKSRYGISFDSYGILMFHPVTTEFDTIEDQVKQLVDAMIESGKKYIVVYPNNDKGSDFIFSEYKRFENNQSILMFPSIRFEYFLTLLKNAEFIIGNSSAGIREAPYYGVATIDIGTRQKNRSKGNSIINCFSEKSSILKAIEKVNKLELKEESHFGDGKSDVAFYDLIKSDKIWSTDKQKYFKDI